MGHNEKTELMSTKKSETEWEGNFLNRSEILFIYFSFIFISWRLITLQYCGGFCHILTWISHGFTCVPHPDPPSHLPPHPIPLGLPSAPALSTYLMHPTWAGVLKQIRNFKRLELFKITERPIYSRIWLYKNKLY